MEMNFDPKAKVKAGDLSVVPDGKQPNQEATNIDFSKDAPGKGKSANYLASEEGSLYEGGEYVTKPGKEHVQNPLLQKADKVKY